MAMKKCKKCGKEISSSAKTCPNCGAKQGLGAGWIIALLIATGLVLLKLFLHITGNNWHETAELMAYVGVIALLIVVYLANSNRL
jgi:hypothetical protein